MPIPGEEVRGLNLVYIWDQGETEYKKIIFFNI